MISQSEFTLLRQQRVEEIEEILKAYLPKQEGYQKVIMEAMEYSLMAGGKRLRPMLMQETYALFGGKNDVIFPFMAAIEMIHTYSLVHDDLPAMDDDAYRRGRKTTHTVYGEAMGVLTGDALLNYAFETALSAFRMVPEEADQIQKALLVLSEKSGIHGMIGGQVIDVENSASMQTVDELNTMYALKTGALIEASMEIGAILAGALDSEVETVEKIAADVGLAFQIQDDILDIRGNGDAMGKSVHNDEKNAKITYPVLIGVEEASKVVEEKTEEAVACLDKLPGECDFLKQLLLELIHRDR